MLWVFFFEGGRREDGDEGREGRGRREGGGRQEERVGILYIKLKDGMRTRGESVG